MGLPIRSSFRAPNNDSGATVGLQTPAGLADGLGIGSSLPGHSPGFAPARRIAPWFPRIAVARRFRRRRRYSGQEGKANPRNQYGWSSASSSAGNSAELVARSGGGAAGG